MFHDREDAARQLARVLQKQRLHDPLVLAIPRGGVVTGAVLAWELKADLDVVLARKLRAPGQPELAIGALAEDGHVFLNDEVCEALDVSEAYLEAERQRQRQEIARRMELLRRVRPRVPIAGRSVIVTDDGIATGSTMIAALQTIRTQHPREVVVAVPVGSPDRLQEIRQWCDQLVCLHEPWDFRAVGQFYEDFRPVEDEEVVALLRDFTLDPRFREPAAVSER